MDVILATIIGVTLSGTTVFAYKHPKAYEKLYPWLLATCFATFALGFIWDLSTSWTLIAVDPYIDSGKRGEARKAVKDITVFERAPYLQFVDADLMFYLMFLCWGLPLLLREDARVNKERDKQY